METVSTKQKTLDLIRLAEGMMKNNCEPKEMREITRLIVECITNLNLKQIRRQLKDNGFTFYPDKEMRNDYDRLEELKEYYNQQMTKENGKELYAIYETIEKCVVDYQIYPKIISFKNVIIEWCDKSYNELISETYNGSITYNIKYISQIKNDIIEVYSRYVFDTKFNDSDKETLNKISNKDNRKRFERFFEGQHSYNDKYIPKIEMDDIIVIDNTICTIVPCIIMDSDGWENGEFDNRMWCDDEKYNKYRKYMLNPSMVFLGYDNSLNIYDTLEELYNKVIEFGGKIYKVNGTSFKLKNK